MPKVLLQDAFSQKNAHSHENRQEFALYAMAYSPRRENIGKSQVATSAQTDTDEVY
jgi:hypothetical protein